MGNYIMDDSSMRKERSLKEWREIFTISTRKTGLNIKEYLGSAKVVYLPDMMGNAAVGSIDKAAFPKDVIVLCSNWLFAKLSLENKDATVCALLSDASIFTEEEKEYLTAVFKKSPARYLEQVILLEDQIALAEGLKLCASKKLLDECFEMTEHLGKTNMNFVLLDFSSKTIEKSAQKKVPASIQNDAAACAITIKEARKTFSLSVGKEGIIISGYKGDSADLIIPEQIEEHKVVEIKGAAFDQNEIIQSVVLPQTLKKIGESAFHFCKQLKKICIPDSVESIGAYAFAGCENLREITLPKKISKVGEAAFLNCPGLADENGFAIYKDCLYGYFGTETTVTVPQNVKKIGVFAFSDLIHIKEIALPDRLKTIGLEAFSHCSSLTSIFIPAGVKKLESGTFCGCVNLEHAYLTSSITEIDKYSLPCFFSCEKLTIHAPAGSYAEVYAKENNITFVAENE